MKFSIVIPAWNEAYHIVQSLKRLREISDPAHSEIILVDGGSTDKTVSVARPWVDRVETLASPNRGAQLHRGASVATGDMLFFLHADTQPPMNWQERLEKFWLAGLREDVAATVFSVDYGSRWNYQLVAWGQNLRTSWLQVAFGDQGFCTTLEIYRKSGGFPEIPLMEDVAFCERLRRCGRIALLPDRILPATRRLLRNGPLRNAARNAWILARYSLGAPPEALWKRYYSQVERAAEVRAAARAAGKFGLPSRP